MATVVIVANYVAVAERFQLNRARVTEEITEAGAMHHSIGSEVLNYRIAGGVTDDWDMVVQRTERRVGSSTG